MGDDELKKVGINNIEIVYRTTSKRTSSLDTKIHVRNF